MMAVEYFTRIRNAGRTSHHAGRDAGKHTAEEATDMAMIINTNVSALNAQRNLSNTSAKMSKNLEKLSSGLRINRAADDAAGLAISEKMRSQIRGMQQGQRNAQDGVSMLQTAEGALGEVHNILQRVRELSVQAGNTTLSSSDRTAIGEEMVALKSEVDNIAQRTRFNGLDLLNGSLATTLSGGTAAAVTATENAATVSVSSIDVGEADASSTYTLSTLVRS
jgi:flagellin